MTRSQTPEHLAFGLKGDRKYVHGTSIYSACRDLLARPRDFVVSHLIFHEMLRGDARVVRFDDGEVPELLAECRLSRGDLVETLGLVADGPPSIDRSTFEEERIVAACAIDTDSVRLEADTGFDSIEEVVAMIKAWHLEHLPDAGKWLFVRLDARAGGDLPARREGPIEARLAGRLGTRMTRFLVSVDGRESMITFGSRR
jgi:hypothetical protein